MNKLLNYIYILLFFIFSTSVFAQDILTANDYFDSISEKYGNIKDFQCNVKIIRENNTKEEVSEGLLFYKMPDLLRINFSTPEEQVLVSNRENLTIYIPEHRVIMSQNLKGRGQGSPASMVTKQGLKLLKRNYSIAYLKSPNPVFLDEVFKPGSSREKVFKLKLLWRSTKEGFRQLNISVTLDGFIRRIEGITADYSKIQLDFTDVKINQNIPDARFEYDSPASANVYENFLFDPEG